MRLWLQAGDGFIQTFDEPVRLFELLFRRLLCDMDRNSKVTIMCIRCMERLYSKHSDKIGVFEDAMILVRLMALTASIETQHRLLSLVATLLGVAERSEEYGKVHIPGNAEQLLNAESVSQLCQFVAWGHTNTAQIGNLLSNTVGGATGTGVKMLTDGSGMKPGGSGNSKSNPSSQKKQPSNVANDASCPKVWFVAPAGMIPPSPNTIRGPHRISELTTLMKEGSLHPHSLVSAVTVEDYSDKDPHNDDLDDPNVTNAVNEGSIDTGKWRSLNQVWQLRWQLCSDGESSGVFSPSEVAYMALRAINRLVDLHKSVDARGVPYHPIPIAKKLLCGIGNESTFNAVKQNDTVFQNKNDAHMIMEKGDAMSVLTQAMLCNDFRIVDASAKLLISLMIHNEEACSKLYLTGIYFFACGYTGSNFHSLAKLLSETHLKQNFRSGFAAVAAKEADSDLPVKERSILGNILPEGVLFQLVNYGMERFSEVFVGNYDTPEVIWSLEMRQHLVEMIRQHLGDFPKRLWQNTTTKYEYCPIPGVAYERLKKELFCHHYYLDNLCDEVRFPNWPISDPVEVFRACLEEWKKQMSRSTIQEEDAQETARKVLGLKSGDSGSELRKAYRNLARKYHPDKNPAGREMFEKIQVSYEVLLVVVEGGGVITASGNDDMEDDDDIEDVTYQSSNDTFREDCALGLNGGVTQMDTIGLLLKTQTLICKRHSDEIGAYKYPVYKMLFQCLEIPSSSENSFPASPDDGTNLEGEDDKIKLSCLLQPKRAEFVRIACELVFQTCLVSPLNAEELCLEGGVPVLEALLHFYIQACRASNSKKVNKDVASMKVLLEIITHLVRTISGIVYFESGRNAILNLDDPERFGCNWRRCIDGCYWSGGSGKSTTSNSAPNAKKYALEGVASLSRNASLQTILIGSGVLWPLLRSLLAYDPTHEEISQTSNSSKEDEDSSSIGGCMSQQMSNTHAQLSARALGMLCGVMVDERLSTPSNLTLLSALQKLLTIPMSKMLRNQRAKELLKHLNRNVETPTRIWNLEMREELLEFLNEVESKRIQGYQDTEKELEVVNDGFEYSYLQNEIVIGGVYVRVFNGLGEGREGIREIADCGMFARELLKFIKQSLILGQGIDVGYIQEEKEQEKEISSSSRSWVAVSDPRFVMSVIALRSLSRVDGLIEDVLCDDQCGGPAVLLSLLELPQNSEAFDVSSDVLALMSPKQPFADAVARQGELWRILQILERGTANESSSSTYNSYEDEDELQAAIQSQSLAKRQERGWSFLESLASTPSVADCLVSSSAWLELLGIMVGYAKFTKLWAGRLGSAKTLTRLLWDPSTGTTIEPILQRFIPCTLVSRLKDDGAEVMLRLFDTNSETPELIWDAEMRTELRTSMSEQLDLCLISRKKYALPPGFYVKYTKLADELYIGGVYVRLFLKEPTFALRDPSAFLEMLLQRWGQELESLTNGGGAAYVVDLNNTDNESNALTTAKQDVLELVTSASVYLCKVRISLCDKISTWGYMPRALDFLQRSIVIDMVGTPMVSAVRMIHAASSRRVNVEAIAIVGDGNGRNGVVDLLLQAIGGREEINGGLHVDTGFMVEILKNLFTNALGDVHNAPKWDPPVVMEPATETVSNDEIHQQQHDVGSNVTIVPPMQHQPDQQHSWQSQQPEIPNQQTMSLQHVPYETDPIPAHQEQFYTTESRVTGMLSEAGHSNMNTAYDVAADPLQYPTMDGYNNSNPNHLQPINGQQTFIGNTQQMNVAKDSLNMAASSSYPYSNNSATFSSIPQEQQHHLYDGSSPINTISEPWDTNVNTRNFAPAPFEHNPLMPNYQQHQMPLDGTSYPSNIQQQQINNQPMSMGEQDPQKQQRLQVDINMNTPNSYTPEATHGEGIDARSAPAPESIADQKSTLVPGAPGSARGRVSLLHQALECNLAPFLLESILDSPSLSSCKDPASAKVHAVDLCKLLILDPGYGMKFELILEGLPGWKKYGSQDHSLFITGSEQKADYFLTNGENSEPMKLLTGS